MSRGMFTSTCTLSYQCGYQVLKKTKQTVCTQTRSMLVAHGSESMWRSDRDNRTMKVNNNKETRWSDVNNVPLLFHSSKNKC